MLGRHLLAAALLGAGIRPLHAQEPADTSHRPPKLVEEGLFPKSIRIPGTDASLSIGGYAKVDFIQDLDAIGNRFEFKVNSIPAEGTAAAAQSGQTTIHAKESRINLDLRSGQGAKHLHVFVEGDFFGDNNAFRLRHAFGEYGRLLGGQTWTTFMDITVRPLTLDFEGPEGEVFLRQAMVRWTQPMGKHWKWAIAVENPNPQFVVPSTFTGAPRATMPDIPAFVRYDGGTDEADVSTMGWGVNASARVKLFGNDALMGQFGVGEGAASYVDAFNGQKVDAVLAADGSDVAAVGNYGGMVGYIRQWSPSLRSGIAYSNARVSTSDGLSGGEIREVQDVRVNTLWKPFKLVEYGVEALWGRRVNQDGSEGDAWRVQASLIYHFN
jgi:hypothetical protein